MSFRVTPHRSYELGMSNSQARYAHSAVLNQQVSSGFRVNKPSDDPVAQKLILGQNALIARFETQLTTINSTRTVLSEANSSLLDAQQLMVKAKSIALDSSQSVEPTERTAFINELDSILAQLEQIANSQINGEYLFSGTQLNTQPFTGISSSNPIYQGSDFSSVLTIPGSQVIQTHYSGREVFQPYGSGQLTILGNSQVQAGTGTSTGTAITKLTLKHTSTAYAAGSGVEAGTGSVDGDTILGASGLHKLTINDTSGNGSSGTVSLNGGDAVSFTNADSNLKITGPDGEVVFINTQSITSGFNGTVDITSNGTLSIDGGATQIPIDFSANQMVTGSAPGVVQYFNTTNVKSTGTAVVEPSASADVFQAVISLRETILNSENLSATDRENSFERRLQQLDSASNNLLNIIGKQAVSLENLDTLETRVTSQKLNAETILSDAQSTDYFAAITQLQEQQNLLMFTLQSLTTLSKVSLVDFLR
ncbi:flagellar hook-associated protein FlgL [Planctomicrobium sp. SH527]|uniref:flagellar hook-associated protein FlgL n=1 Tax=Planctomicrobium sp. SH527 TaxID=3448123 RepID=UPI003F5B43BE